MLIQNTSGGQNYSQWTWPKWVVPYRLRRFSHQFEHPKSTPHPSCKTFQRFKQGRAVSAATCSTTSAYSPAFSLARRWQQSSAWGNQTWHWTCSTCINDTWMSAGYRYHKSDSPKKTKLSLIFLLSAKVGIIKSTTPLRFTLESPRNFWQGNQGWTGWTKLHWFAPIFLLLAPRSAPEKARHRVAAHGGAWRCVWEPIEVICW